MSRDEARRQLEGTFNFELDSGQVVVRDELLLKEIGNLLSGESASENRATGWPVHNPAAGQFGYQAAPV